MAVKEEFPNSTIIRPADVYAQRDRFWTRAMAHSRNTILHNYYLDRAGEVYKMPIYAGDLALGLQRIVQDPTLDGQTYEFVG